MLYNELDIILSSAPTQSISWEPSRRITILPLSELNKPYSYECLFGSFFGKYWFTY